MKPTRVIYSRLINKGNYENAKIEIEVQIEENDSLEIVFSEAKKWVENKIKIEKLSEYDIKRAMNILKDRLNHTVADVEAAEEIIKLCNFV